MKISVNIKVRNPEWYWSAGDILDSKKKGQMSYESWKQINEGKIFKHLPAISFNYDFEVQHHSENRKANYELTVYDLEYYDAEHQQKQTAHLENVTLLEFKGDRHLGQVVISNDLIHRFIGAKMREGTYYWYFYLRENADYVQLLENIWITKHAYEKIRNQFEKYGFAVKNDPNLIVRGLRNSFPVSSGLSPLSASEMKDIW